MVYNHTIATLYYHLLQVIGTVRYFNKNRKRKSYSIWLSSAGYSVTSYLLQPIYFLKKYQYPGLNMMFKLIIPSR